MDKKKKIEIVFGLVILLVFSSWYLLAKKDVDHQKKYLESYVKPTKKSTTYLYDEKSKIEFRKDSIDINMCFKLVTNDTGGVDTFNLVCVCTCNEYEKK